MIVTSAIDRVAHLPISLLCEVGISVITLAFVYKAEQVIPEEWRSQFIAESDGFVVLMIIDFSPYCDYGAAGVIVSVCFLGFLALAPNVVELLLTFSRIPYVI